MMTISLLNDGLQKCRRWPAKSGAGGLRSTTAWRAAHDFGINACAGARIGKLNKKCYDVARATCYRAFVVQEALCKIVRLS
jgi:hypothetical protein